MKKTTLLISAAGIAMTATPLLAQDDDKHSGMFRYPDVGKDHILFVYANDIWIVDKKGGEARPVASPAGQEQHPKFSPDETHIAFVGNYEGDRDLYTVPTAGGIPMRVMRATTGPVWGRVHRGERAHVAPRVPPRGRHPLHGVLV